MTTLALHREPWPPFKVGAPPHRVTAFEHTGKGGVAYLKWRVTLADDTREWRHESLGFRLRDPKGRLLPDLVRKAQGEAAKKHAALVAGERAAEEAPRLTLAEGFARIAGPNGKYPVDTPHRREVERSLDDAVRVLGARRTFESIRVADLRELWRARVRELRARGTDGKRGAEVTVARLLTVAEWLRAEEHISPTACVAPRRWKVLLADDWRLLAGARGNYEPRRPRHTLEEMRAILGVADRIDPRFWLLVALGAELRLGQVARAMRSDLDLAERTFRVLSSGKKGGVVVHLTDGQLAAAERALAGYLADLEATYLADPAANDYRLFPSGQLPGGRKGAPRASERHRLASPVNRRTVIAWWHEAEKVAGVKRVRGRAAYGVRRAAVDAAKELGISREGLKAHGGWTDTQVPDSVYAEGESEQARHEAAEVRAKLRGER